MAEPRIPTVDQSRQDWDKFSTDYEATSQAWTNLTDVELQYMAKLQTAKGVVVPGAGPGLGGFQVRQQIPADSKVAIGDLSPEMVRLTENLFKKNGVEFDSEEGKTIIKVMDNQELPLPSESYDRYISNLSIMLVPDPVKQLKEAYRVLQPGGIALVSTWGRPANTTFFSIPPRVMGAMGLPKNPDRSPFHLGDEEKLKSLFKEAGFSDVRTYYKIVRQPIYHSADEYVEFLRHGLAFDEKIQKLGDKAEEYLRRIKEECQAVIDSGELISFEHLIAIAFKQA